MAGKPESQARLKVTQTKSTISHIARNRATIKALGLHGIGSTSVVPDNDATRGMVRQVRFLVSVERIAEPARERTGRAATNRSKDRGDAPRAIGPRIQGDAPRAIGPRIQGDAPASHRSEDEERA
jgi:large subunit ribosomal protein L30